MIERIIRIYDDHLSVAMEYIGTSQYYFMNRSWTVLKYTRIMSESQTILDKCLGTGMFSVDSGKSEKQTEIGET